jgi:hypothetical protein
METARLCRFCRDFKLIDALDELPATHLREVYRISHAEFFECASSCDICEVTAQHFLEDADTVANSEDQATAVIRASIQKDFANCRLIFCNKINWHRVNWTVWTSQGPHVHN